MVNIFNVFGVLMTALFSSMLLFEIFTMFLLLDKEHQLLFVITMLLTVIGITLIFV